MIQSEALENVTAANGCESSLCGAQGSIHVQINRCPSPSGFGGAVALFETTRGAGDGEDFLIGEDGTCTA